MKRRISVVVGLTVILGLPLLFQNCSQVGFQRAENLFSKDSVACHDTQADAVKPKLKWDWIQTLDPNDAANFPRFNQVMMTPVVRDLDKDGVPEVVFTAWSLNPVDWAPDSGTGAHYTRNGVLRVISGRDGHTLHSVGDFALAPLGTGQPGLADLDGDGNYEIIYLHYSGTALIALNRDASLRWKLPLPAPVSPAVEVTSFWDFSRNRRVLAISGYLVGETSSQQPEILAATGHTGGFTTYAYPLDVDHPQDLTLFDNSGAYSANTLATKFIFPSATMTTAVAELDSSQPGLEVVGTGGGRLWIMSSAGVVLVDKDLGAYNQLQCSGRGIGGGAPTVGDFDGDPATTEIAMATGRYLTVFSAKGELLAQSETQDCSSLVTGITSFDFNGDGKPEIVYSDEEYLRIYEMRNGALTTIFQTPNPSGTLYEYPVVVDAAGDGTSQLIVASNNYAAGDFYATPEKSADRAVAAQITGVRSFVSSTKASWMPTPAAWTQYSFNPLFEIINPNSTTWMNLVKGYLTKTFRRNAQLDMFEPKCIR